jgi:hypothetical protein
LREGFVFDQRRDGKRVEVAQHTRGAGPAAGAKPWSNKTNPSFREKIAEYERGPGHTGDGYDAKHPGSRALGRYQLTPIALQDIGWQDEYGNWTAKAKAQGVASEADFLNKPDAQEAALGAYFKRNDEQLDRNGSRRHLGEKYVSPIGKGFVVTEAGLAAAAHRSGAPMTKHVLEKLEKKRNGHPQKFTAKENQAIYRMRELADVPFKRPE